MGSESWPRREASLAGALWRETVTIREGSRTSTSRIAIGVAHSAMSGHFAHRGTDDVFGQQSMSPDMAMLTTADEGARVGVANAVGPNMRPANRLIANAIRMSAREVTLAASHKGAAGGKSRSYARR